MFESPERTPQPTPGWFSTLTPGQQVGYGCLAIIIIGALTMYCAGTISLLARPMFLNRSTPTAIVFPTLLATPTQAPPTFIHLPQETLLPTPTQAPLPTREPPTLTPTVDLTNPAPTTSGTPPGKTSVTPTHKANTTPTP